LLFLESLGWVFLMRYFSWFFVNLIYAYDAPYMRWLTRSLVLADMTPYLVLFNLIVNSVTGFVGASFRPFLGTICKFQIIVSVFIFMGMLGYIDRYDSGKYEKLHFETVMLFGTTFSFALVGFTISTKVSSSRTRYNSLQGFGISMITSIVVISFLWYIWRHREYETMSYFYSLSITSMIIFYICLNANLLIKYRQLRFFENDAYYAFYSFQTDIFYYFWKYLIKSFRNKSASNKKIVDNDKVKSTIDAIKTSKVKTEPRRSKPKDGGKDIEV